MVRGMEAGHFCEVAGVSIVAAGGLRFVVDIFNFREPSDLNKLKSQYFNLGISFFMSYGICG